VLENKFTDQWYDNLDALRNNAEQEAKNWKTAWQEGDTSIANTFVGEVTGLINEIQPVEEILSKIVGDAKVLLDRKWE
jgi:NAD(P)H-dependent flavin oxidoreductase YrpB (nitropropane dioxygenase family)